MDATPEGPLHLQPHLTVCTDALGDVIRKAVDHPLSSVRGLYCDCKHSGVQRAPRNGDKPSDSGFRRGVAGHHQSSRRLAVQQPPPVVITTTPVSDERRQACRFFSVQTNDEEGIILCYCRRCERMLNLYDRVMYWGTRRASTEEPLTYPYRCSCGGHTFEIAMGFLYPPEALDENDIDTITIAVRCVGCEEAAVIFDDEAT